jgi:hypothetical protein
MMAKAVLLRVGIDSGSGGIQGPLFKDGSFEFISIPDKKGVSIHTYGTCLSQNGIPHSDFFPMSQRHKVARQHVHLDPEFDTFTYGDPTPLKRSLQKLENRDYLIFYCGLQEWDERDGWKHEQRPGLFVVGYFVVDMAGMATDFDRRTLQSEFGQNFHVRYPSVFKIQRDRLVLVKGGRGSRMLKKAYRISSEGSDRSGKPLKVFSPEMQKVFGGFDGKVSIQRSPPRWVDSAFVDKTIKCVKELP